MTNWHRAPLTRRQQDEIAEVADAVEDGRVIDILVLVKYVKTDALGVLRDRRVQINHVSPDPELTPEGE